jgi:DNA (cytosine-5)-methyltransferase 1
MNAIDLFSGAGGLLIALKQAEFDVLFANEINEKFSETHRYNFPTVPLLLKDIRDVTRDDMLSFTHNEPIRLIVGGPPCQGFSMFGKRRFVNTQGYNPQDDERNYLVYEFIRVIDELKPSFFMMENVKGFVSLDGGQFVAEVQKKFNSIGYNNIWCNIVCALDYGVPQERYRMFMIGNNIGIDFEPPSPSHFAMESGKLPTYRTVGDTIMDIVDKDENSIPNHIALRHKAIVAARMGYVEEGEKLDIERLPKELLVAPRKDSKNGSVSNYSHVYRRLSRNKPSTTMVPGHNAFPIHPTLNRTLTPREAARLQTFPDTHVFFGTRQEQCIQVGNAVPPKMALPFFKKIAHYLAQEGLK